MYNNNNLNINLSRRQNKSINNTIKISNSYLNPLDNNIIYIPKIRSSQYNNKIKIYNPQINNNNYEYFIPSNYIMPNKVNNNKTINPDSYYKTINSNIIINTPNTYKNINNFIPVQNANKTMNNVNDQINNNFIKYETNIDNNYNNHDPSRVSHSNINTINKQKSPINEHFVYNYPIYDDTPKRFPLIKIIII